MPAISESRRRTSGPLQLVGGHRARRRAKSKLGQQPARFVMRVMWRSRREDLTAPSSPVAKVPTVRFEQGAVGPFIGQQAKPRPVAA